MFNEDDVLFNLKEYLLKKSWKILAYKSPGGHGGLIIKIKGKVNMIPDIIAYKNHYLLCIEAKPNYSVKDKNKLDLLFENNELFGEFKRICSIELNQKEIKVPKHIQYIKTLAYAKGTQVPEDFLIFRLSESKDILVNIGKKLTISVNDI